MHNHWCPKSVYEQNSCYMTTSLLVAIINDSVFLPGTVILKMKVLVEAQSPLAKI